jgi:hypothetical protein
MMLHGSSSCAEIGKMGKVQQRYVTIDRASFSQALNQLGGKGFQLGAQASVNDAWFAIDFGDPEFEEAVATYICRFLGQRYSRLKGLPIKNHC